MRNKIFTIGVFVFLIIFCANRVSAQTKCVFGLENDPAPGNCGSYIDKNVNKLCDLSEVPLKNSTLGFDDVPSLSEEELKTKTVKEVAEVYGVDINVYCKELSSFLNIDVKAGDSLLDLHDNNGLCAGVAGNIALALKTGKEVKEVDIEKDIVPRYQFLSVTLTLIILYLITYILVKEKKITLLTHRRIWNIVLLFAFLVSVIFGILLVLRINQGWNLNLPFDMLYWHVESGVVMAVVTFFHLTWHWKYYSCMLKRKKKEECDSQVL